jgi:hypothetical protein
MFSFNRRKHRQQVARLLRRLADVTSPNLRSSDRNDRTEDRVNRSCPVVVAPWTDIGPDPDRCITAVSKDFSDRGLALITQHPLGCEDVVVGFILPARDSENLRPPPNFAIAKVRQFVPLGGGFWQIGLELVRMVDPSRSEAFGRLETMAAKLTPAKTAVEVG